VDEIAAAVGISRKHLYSVFNDILKIPPKQYLIYYRIEKACTRLKSTDQSVQEIAESVGYSNQFYFSKEFKRLTGRSPSEYRKSPNRSEIFSYRSFLSTLKEQLEDHSLDLPVNEQILSVYLPPQPVGARPVPQEGEKP
jgi:AraC-like DNA-binding protein